jgi:hypothetical protein
VLVHGKLLKPGRSGGLSLQVPEGGEPLVSPGTKTKDGQVIKVNELSDLSLDAASVSPSP